MKSKLAALLLASATLGAGPAIFAPPASARAEVEVSFSYFHDSLEPYGEWVQVGDYGLCWRPNDVDENWSPYTDGYWSYTDAGWTWVSYEDYGGIVYHYGRWVRVEDEGWCWVPDTEWGPAWVSWRNNDDYVGWAPLPPEAHWKPEVGFSVWVDNSYDIGPSNYNFCAVRDFGAPVIREVIIERPRNYVIIANTVNITNITVNRGIGVPFCGGPRYDYFVGRVNRPIPTLKLVRQTNITNINNTVINNKTVINNNNTTIVRPGRPILASVQGNQLIVPAPKVKPLGNPKAALAQYKPTKVFGADKVSKGWQGAKDPEERARLKQKIAQDVEGLKPDNAPAKPIQTAELKPVPVKGDANAPSPVDTARNPGRQGRPGKGDAPNAIAPGEPAPGVVNADKPMKGERPDRQPGVANGKQKGPGKNEKPDAAVTPNVETPAINPPDAPTAQIPEPDRPGKPGKGKGQNVPGAAENRGPLKPFNAENPNGKGKGKGKANDVADTPDANVPAPGAADAQIPNRPAVVAPPVDRERPGKPNRGNDNPDQPGMNAQERMRQKEQAVDRQEKQAQQAEAQRARRQQAEQEQAQQQEAQRQKAMERRQRDQNDSNAENQRQRQLQQQQAAEMRRQQAAQQDLQERRQAQAEANQRRAQQQQAAEGQEIRRQQQAQAEARREQMQNAQREQAQRQQQIQAQRQQQAERAQEMQRQAQPQRPQGQQVQPQGGKQGGGQGEGRGRRALTPEEAAALKNGR